MQIEKNNQKKGSNEQSQKNYSKSKGNTPLEKEVSDFTQKIFGSKSHGTKFNNNKQHINSDQEDQDDLAKMVKEL